MGGRVEIYGWYRKVWVVVRKSMGGTEKVWVVTKSVGFIKIYGWKRKYMGGIINVRSERHSCPISDELPAKTRNNYHDLMRRFISAVYRPQQAQLSDLGVQISGGRRVRKSGKNSFVAGWNT